MHAKPVGNLSRKSWMGVEEQSLHRDKGVSSKSGCLMNPLGPAAWGWATVKEKMGDLTQTRPKVR